MAPRKKGSKSGRNSQSNGESKSGGSSSSASSVSPSKHSSSSSTSSFSSSSSSPRRAVEVDEPEPTWWAAITTYFGYGVLFVYGFIRDLFGNIFKAHEYRPKPGYAPLLVDFEDFYTRRLYRRIQDCWNRPISSCPGAWIDVMERTTTNYNKTLTLSGETKRCLNLGSYNYLGFGDPVSPTKPAVLEALNKFSVATTSTRMTAGNTSIHVELERLVADFVGKPAALVFGMGFGTNSTGIPSLIGKGDLIISDAYNHSSIVFGARSSGAKIKVFKHNDVSDLENVVRQAIVEGQPRTRRPWRKILIMVEGIYSMEGEICPLAEIVAVKKKYKCYLYVDEAHSIGALGRTGRGICEHARVDPADVDILMGTFTKSFGAVGGYIAATEELISYLRAHSAGSLYSASISPPACQQVISAFNIILGRDGTDIGRKRIKQLHDNANYFRREAHKLGLHILGHDDSPVIPIMLYNPTKIPAFSRECLKRNLAVVVVGFPATPLLLSRARICISAAHTRKDLDFALEKIGEVADILHLRYARYTFG